MTIGRHADHPPETPCRPAGNGLCEPLILSRVRDLTGVPLKQIPGDPAPEFSSSI